MWHWSADALFNSCQLTVTWMSIRMSNLKLNTDCICFGHLASNAQSLQENSQSEHAYYCSHIIIQHKDPPPPPPPSPLPDPVVKYDLWTNKRNSAGIFWSFPPLEDVRRPPGWWPHHCSLGSLTIGLCSWPFTWYKTAMLESKSGTGRIQTKEIII